MRPKLDEPTIELLSRNVETGASIVDACTLSNVSRQTYYDWLGLERKLTAKAEKEPLTAAEKQKIVLSRLLADRVQKATARFKQAQIDNVVAAAKKSWQASAWLLERRFPDEYGRTVNVTPDSTTDFKVILCSPSADTDKRVAQIEQALKNGN